GSEEDAPQPADLGHAAFREPVGGDRRRNPLVGGQREDLAGGVVDAGGAGLGAVEVEPLDLVRHLDQAAGVDDVVGRVEDAAVGEALLHAGVGELVVGGAADHLRLQDGHRLVVEGPTERAGGVHVEIGADHLVAVRDDLDLRVQGPDPVYGRLVDVADDDVRAVLAQVLHQAVADLADAFYADSFAPQRGRTPHGLGRGAHALVHAERGQYRGVSGAAVLDGPAGDEAALAGDDVHVLAVRADVAGRVVAAVERLDEPPVRPQFGLGLLGGGVSDDDGFASTEVQPRQGGLVRHAAGQVQHVGESLLLRRVGVEAGASQGRAERGGVDGDDGSQAACLVLAEDDLLVGPEARNAGGYG